MIDKFIYIVRHAKAEAPHLQQHDIERCLAERGILDAAQMANNLLDTEVTLDCIVSSPAIRAITTAFIFSKIILDDANKVITNSDLYLPSLQSFENVVSELNNNLNCVALFSHNDGITTFANSLSDNFKIDNMPTSCVLGFKINCKNWKEFKNGSIENIYIDFPKKNIIS